MITGLSSEVPFSLCIEELSFYLFAVKQQRWRRRFGRKATGYPFGKVPGQMSKRARALVCLGHSHRAGERQSTLASRSFSSLTRVSMWGNRNLLCRFLSSRLRTLDFFLNTGHGWISEKFFTSLVGEILCVRKTLICGVGKWKCRRSKTHWSAV